LTFLKKIKGVQEELPKCFVSPSSSLYKQKNSNYNRELELTYKIRSFISLYEKNCSHFPSPVLTVSGSMGIISA